MSEQATVEKKTEVKRPVSRKEMTRWQWTWKEMKRNYIAYIMIFPFFLIFSVFTIGPVVLSLFFSLTDFS